MRSGLSSRSFRRCLLVLWVSLFLSASARTEDSRKAEAALGRKAPQILLTVKLVAIGPVGDGGDIARAELALRALLKRADAIPICQKLIAEGSPTGQLYGLLGLRLLRAREFDAVFPRYQNSELRVAMFSGCIIYGSEMRRVAADIKSGKIQ